MPRYRVVTAECRSVECDRGWVVCGTIDAIISDYVPELGYIALGTPAFCVGACDHPSKYERAEAKIVMYDAIVSADPTGSYWVAVPIAEPDIVKGGEATVEVAVGTAVAAHVDDNGFQRLKEYYSNMRLRLAPDDIHEYSLAMGPGGVVTRFVDAARCGASGGPEIASEEPIELQVTRLYSDVTVKAVGGSDGVTISVRYSDVESGTFNVDELILAWVDESGTVAAVERYTDTPVTVDPAKLPMYWGLLIVARYGDSYYAVGTSRATRGWVADDFFGQRWRLGTVWWDFYPENQCASEGCLRRCDCDWVFRLEGDS